MPKKNDPVEEAFNKFAEKELGDDGLPTNNMFIGKRDLKKIAYDEVKRQKKLDDASANEYLNYNFANVWSDVNKS